MPGRVPGEWAWLALLWLVVPLLLGPAGRAPRAATPSADDEAIRAAFLRHAADIPARFTPAAVARIEVPEDICWTWSAYLKALLLASDLTAEPLHLTRCGDALDTLLTRLRTGPDGFQGFRGLPLPLFRNPATPTAEMDNDIAEFEIVAVITALAERVRAQPSLQTQLGQRVDGWLKLAREQLAGPKWDRRGLWQELPQGGAVMRMPAECGNGRDSLTNPHNKQSKICRTYLALYRVTGEADYFRRAVRLGTRFKRTIRRDGERYLWHYWDPAGPWDYRADQPAVTKHWVGPEHRGGYHALTVAMAVELYDHGVVFDRADLEAIRRTQLEVCWNGSLTDPVYRKTDGGQPEAGQGAMVATSLARLEPRLVELLTGPTATAERLASRDHGWRGLVGATDYLALKYLPQPPPEPTRQRYREQFCADPANAAWLAQVAYRVP
ncbi:MAG: hypothetical protein IT204_09155 [Fimbriimonadaceae bacterium]|nr:hypothetical protein [Fimbriimonadaceae bacterium]